MRDIRIYVHIPFCVKKCPYCDFVSYVVGNGGLYDEYVGALCREMELYSDLGKGRRVVSIFLGGGTPSLLTYVQLKKILECIGRNFPNWHGNAEITIEVNPGTIERDSFHRYREAGFNRVSIGVQSFSDEVLRFLGRVHNGRESEAAIREAMGVFDRVSADIIWGVGDDSFERIEGDLSRLVNLHVEHISAYTLTLEENVPLYELMQRGAFELPKDEILAEWYGRIDAMLRSRGYLHYEISNFALPGRFSIHNWGYWRREDYLGFGVSAHSFQSSKNIRWANVRDLRRYFELIESGEKPVEMRDMLDADDEAFEEIWLALRTYLGVRKSTIWKSVRTETLTTLLDQGVLLEERGFIKINPLYWFQQEEIVKILMAK